MTLLSPIQQLARIPVPCLTNATALVAFAATTITDINGLIHAATPIHVRDNAIKVRLNGVQCPVPIVPPNLNGRRPAALARELSLSAIPSKGNDFMKTKPPEELIEPMRRTRGVTLIWQ